MYITQEYKYYNHALNIIIIESNHRGDPANHKYIIHIYSTCIKLMYMYMYYNLRKQYLLFTHTHTHTL